MPLLLSCIGAEHPENGSRHGSTPAIGGEGDDTMYAAQRGFPFRGNVRINREIVNCGPGEDVAYIDRGVDQVKNNCERKINGFPDKQSDTPGADFLEGVIGPSG